MSETAYQMIVIALGCLLAGVVLGHAFWRQSIYKNHKNLWDVHDKDLAPANRGLANSYLADWYKARLELVNANRGIKRLVYANQKLREKNNELRGLNANLTNRLLEKDGEEQLKIELTRYGSISEALIDAAHNGPLARVGIATQP